MSSAKTDQEDIFSLRLSSLDRLWCINVFSSKFFFSFFFFYSHLGLPSPLQHPKPDRVSDVGRSIRSSGLLLYVCPRNRRNSFQFLLHPWGCFFSFHQERRNHSLNTHTHTHRDTQGREISRAIVSKQHCTSSPYKNKKRKKRRKKNESNES